MTPQQLANMTQVFGHMQKRPGMWFSPQVPPVVTWFQGFQMAIRLQYPSLDVDSILQSVIVQRGWESGAQPVWRQMEARGLSFDAINSELVSIYAAVWEQIGTTLQLDPMP
jgi:hypothetical protein